MEPGRYAAERLVAGYDHRCRDSGAPISAAASAEDKEQLTELIVGHTEVVTLSMLQARALLTPAVAKGLFGFDLAGLPQDDETPVLDALDGHGGTATEWRARLQGICVPLLDVNAAPVESLVRIRGLSADDARILVDARPYLNTEELVQEGPDLAVIWKRMAPCVCHSGYLLTDKVTDRVLRLSVDLAEGVLVRQHPQADRADLTRNLEVACLRNVLEDKSELLYLCRWDVAGNPAERPARLRWLKASDAVGSVAPVLRDNEGQFRVPYPDRLDAMLDEEASDETWIRLASAYGLTTVKQYLPHYRSLRVMAHPHDLGALYRTVQALGREAMVRFVEPTYMVV